MVEAVGASLVVFVASDDFMKLGLRLPTSRIPFIRFVAALNHLLDLIALSRLLLPQSFRCIPKGC